MESRGLVEEHEETDESEEPDITMDPNEEKEEEEEETEGSPANSESVEDALTDSDFMQAWREAAKERPLRVLVCGLGGVGKSTLINRLLRLKKNETGAKEGMGGKATTLVVSRYETTTETGIKVYLYDSPGFGDTDMSNEEIIAMMVDETEKKLDMVFYCISLNGSARVQQEDVRAIRIMTQAFTDEIWKKAVIVLTFANVFEERVENAEEYKATISRITEKVQQVLRKDAHVREEIVAQVPIITAGHTEPTLKYETEECTSKGGGWDNRLFLEALSQVDPAVLPALFEVRWSWKDALAALGGGGGGAAVGTGVGAGIGALVGAIGGPAGAAVGAVVGGGIGAGVGGAGGAGTGLLVFQMVKIKSHLKIKYKKWQMKRKLPSP